MPALPALPVEMRIPAENLRYVTRKVVAKPWQAALHLLVDHAPAAIVGAAGIDTLVFMHFRVDGSCGPAHHNPEPIA
jgi:hypothetical protein